MAISGSLKDVSVADVMQFVHLGRRTGTLLLTRGAQHAMIGFHGGRLVSAQAPRTPKLGDLLITSGLIDGVTLDRAIHAQEIELERRSLGQLLVASGAIDAESLRRVIAQQIEQAVSEVMVWDAGTFEFAIDDLRPIDDIALYPSDVLPDADLNTQMVLLEAARIFDERNRGRAEPVPEPLPLPSPSRPGHGDARRAAAPERSESGSPAAPGLIAQHSSTAGTGAGAGGYPDGDSTHPALEPVLARAGRAAAAAGLATATAGAKSGLAGAASAPGPSRGAPAGQAVAGGMAGATAAGTAGAAGAAGAGGAAGAAVLLFEPRPDTAYRRWDVPKHAAERLHLQLVSPDSVFADQLGEALHHEVAGIEGVGIDQAGAAAPGEPPPIVVVDLRRGAVQLEQAATLRRARPRASIIALVDPGMSVAKVYAAGVLTALPPDVEAVAACVENIIESRDDLVRGTSGRMSAASAQSGVARLRRVFGDLRSGLISATVALNLMHIISESVERAVLFLVKREQLMALGAFGADSLGRPLAELTRAIKLPTDSDNVFTRSLRSGEVQSVSFEEARLPEPFRSLVGRSRTGQVVVFPVLGAQRVISAIYADNGDRDQPIEDIDILELATAQVGMAFENELLRRQITQNRED